MKVAVVIARVLMGLVFAVLGADKLYMFIHAPMPPGDAGAMFGLMFVHNWLRFYGCLEVLSGLALLSGRFVPLALTVLGGIGVNILLFHITLEPAELPLPLVLAVIELFLAWAYRESFAGIFNAKAQPKG